MTILQHQKKAFGKPGTSPKWTRSDKDGVGTAYSASSRIWFTLSQGILNEIYYPTIDHPQIRDMQFLITDEETFFHDERRDLKPTTERLCENSLGFRVVSEDPEGRYRIEKEVISAPHAACVMVKTKFVPLSVDTSKIKLFVLLAPHLGAGGWENSGNVAHELDREILTAHKDDNWLALGCTARFKQTSVGYVGESDGWQDLSADLHANWEFDEAKDGNIALLGEIDLSDKSEFVVGVALSDHLHGASTTLVQSLSIPFADHRKKFQEQWLRACDNRNDLIDGARDQGRLYRVSHSLLLSHEDKTYHGAMIASMSIPWGEAKGDDDIGGYHLVWTRDMVNSATGLLAAGNTATPFRALIYLACSQQEDGGFHQNSWIDGDPYWTGIQLDEVAFPILLAWKLHRLDALQQFDPWPMVKAAAGYLIRKGPVTPQERWEENSGYSPSTLASNIAALTCASLFAKERGEEDLSRFFQEYADFLECHIEAWTVTTEGTIVDDISQHFIRIKPADPDNPIPDENPNEGTLLIKNREPGQQMEFPAKDIVDAGFLELVRYGIREAGDKLFEDSLKVVDESLKVETPFGPCWHRYTHDGYGQGSDGGPFVHHGVGRAWPLLTGERAHYELAAGRDVKKYVKAIEQFANCTGLLPEQIWDEVDRPDQRLFLGRPTGSAMPLMWAHAEYIKLLRSIKDGEVFDRIPEVVERYLKRKDCLKLEVWKFNRQVQSVAADMQLRIQTHAAFRLKYSNDGWESSDEIESTDSSVGVHFVDIPAKTINGDQIKFTFYWNESKNWEDREFQIN